MWCSSQPIPSPAYADQHFASFTVTRVQLAEILDSYREVSGEVWRHRYAHVQGGDRTGTIFLKNGQKLKWLVRPGGLATLTGPDGVTHYLARELPRPNHPMQRTAPRFAARLKEELRVKKLQRCALSGAVADLESR